MIQKPTFKIFSLPFQLIQDDSYPTKVCFECINDLLNADLLRDMLLECNSNRIDKIQPDEDDTPLQLDSLEEKQVKQEMFVLDDNLRVDNEIDEPDSDLDMKEEYLIEALEEEEEFVNDETLGVEIDEPKPPSTGFQCNHCLANFSTPIILSRHLQSVHNDNIFKPKEKSSANPTIQKRINRRVNIYHCHRCNQDVTNLSVHVRKFHSHLPPEFKCQYCGAVYEKISTLYTHTYNLHTNKNCAVCDECGEVFNRRCRLEEHKRSKHLGLKIFVCAICTARFARKNNLRAHIRSHTGMWGLIEERSFQIEI